MPTYYRDDTVRVTAVEIEIDGQRYPLARLDYVWHRRTHRFARGSYVLLTRVGTVALAVGFLLAVPAAVLTADLGLNTWHVLSVVALVGTLLAAAAGFGLDPLLELLDRSHDQGHGVHEIWARVQGRELLLFSTVDALRFGKVYRALQRAIERSATDPRDAI